MPQAAKVIAAAVSTSAAYCIHLSAVRAVSCCVMLCCAVQIFDRPFLFFLVDETTQTVLFQGAVTDPSKSG
jgi:serine protease inhibitor